MGETVSHSNHNQKPAPQIICGYEYQEGRGTPNRGSFGNDPVCQNPFNLISQGKLGFQPNANPYSSQEHSVSKNSDFSSLKSKERDSKKQQL